MGCLAGGYQPQRTIREIFVLDELADLGWEPDVAMWKSTKGIEKHLGAAPGGCGGREIEDLLAVDGAKAAIDVGLFRQLLFEKANAEPPERALQRFDLSREVHLLSVDSRPERRNLLRYRPT